MGEENKKKHWIPKHTKYRKLKRKKKNERQIVRKRKEIVK